MASSAPDLGGSIILVIEDHADSLQALADVLTKCGARVLMAGDTLDARAYVGTVKIDLVVTDLALPGSRAQRSSPGCVSNRTTRVAASPRSPSRAPPTSSPG